MAGPGATATSILPLLSERIKGYAQSVIWSKGATPLLADMEVKADSGEGGGRKIVHQASWGGGQGVANPSFSKAQANRTAGRHDRWEVTPTFLTGSLAIDVKAMVTAQGEATKKNIVKVESELHLKEWRRKLAILLVGNGTGSLAQATAVSTTGFTVPTADIWKFRIGDTVVASSTEFSAVLRNSGTGFPITGVDEDTGIVTVTGNPSGASVGATDFWFIDGWRENSATPTKQVFDGTATWLPATAQTDTFNNVLRTGNFEAGGRRFDGQGKQLAEALIKGVNKIFNATGDGDFKIYCDSLQFAAMTADRDAFKITSETNKKNSIGYSQTMLEGTQAGSIPVVPDVTLAGKNIAYAINQNPDYMPYFCYASEGMINVLDMNGTEMLHVADAMQYEIRTFSHITMIVPVPGRHLLIKNWGVA